MCKELDRSVVTVLYGESWTMIWSCMKSGQNGMFSGTRCAWYAILYKNNNFSDFFFALLYPQTPSEKGSSLSGANSLLLE